MSLVRFSYTENPINALKKKIRHTYNLHQLLRQEEYIRLFHSPAFDQMLLKVGQDDVISFKNNNQWLAFHPKDDLIYSDTENVWNELKGVYNDISVPFLKQIYKTQVEHRSNKWCFFINYCDLINL